MAQTAEIIQFDRSPMDHEQSDEQTVDIQNLGGYIKLFRSLQEAAFASRPEYMAAWVHILMLASHKPHKTMAGNRVVHVQTGQFVSGRITLAERVGVSEKQIRTIVDFFVREGMITKKVIGKGSLFTVCNYSSFQSKKGQIGPDVSGQQKGQRKPSNGAASSETGASKKASNGPEERATTQEDNKSIPNGIVTYDSSGDESPAKKLPPKKSSPSYPQEFEWIWQNRPRRSGPDPKKKAFQACKARIKQGATWRELAEGMKRYAKHCQSAGKLNTQFTMQMATFFGPDEHYQTEDFGTDQRSDGLQRKATKGPDWDDTDWANDLGGL